MSFLDTWNGAYEGIPADNENTNLGANRIRDFKVNIRERVQVNHSFAGDANDGKHTAINLMAQSGNPSVAGTDGFLFTKPVGGVTELFWMDSAGEVLQLTSLGKLNSAPFPSGTNMMFLNPAPPVGWTQIIGLADRMIRLTDGAGTGIGGSWTLSGTSVSTTVTTTTTTTTTTTAPTITVADAGSTAATGVSDGGSTVSGTVGSHALTANELPALNVTTNLPGTQHSTSAGIGTATADYTFGATQAVNGTGGAGHTHSWSGSLALSLIGTTSLTLHLSGSASVPVSTSNSSSSSPASSSFSNDGTWRPLYIDAVAATKA